MDSLTQIVLGAACGEIVLGKKVGNRAMLWGAIGGTIPDLDVVIGKLFMQPIDALAFHRGFMHSLLFAVLFPFVMALIVHALYASNLYLNKWYKRSLFSVWMLLMILILYQINISEIQSEGSFPWARLIVGILLLISAAIFMLKRYVLKVPNIAKTSYADWYWLFFWSIFTHPLLDSCTTYGTQLFQPFSDFRVSFNNISVADPLYTLPFLCCLLVASWFARGLQRRYHWNLAGVVISSFYMLFTVGNKLYIDSKFEKSLEKAGISYQRYTTSPTILNNIYWKGTAENDTAYFHAGYSHFDNSEYFEDFIVFPKNQQQRAVLKEDDTFQTLAWFSNGYYFITQIDSLSYQISDLRFGLSTDTYTDREDFIFKFLVNKEENGLVLINDGSPPRDDKMKSVFERLMVRIMGK